MAARSWDWRCGLCVKGAGAVASLPGDFVERDGWLESLLRWQRL